MSVTISSFKSPWLFKIEADPRFLLRGGGGGVRWGAVEKPGEARNTFGRCDYYTLRKSYAHFH